MELAVGRGIGELEMHVRLLHTPPQPGARAAFEEVLRVAVSAKEVLGKKLGKKQPSFKKGVRGDVCLEKASGESLPMGTRIELPLGVARVQDWPSAFGRAR